MSCKICQERDKTWNGSDPICAFEGSEFDENNWNCATMNELRCIAEEREVSYNEDQYLAVIPMKDECSFVILSWYKSRGRTEGAWKVDSGSIEKLKEEDAIKIIENSKEARKGLK